MGRYFRKSIVVFSVLFLVLVSCRITQAADTQISGTISLPTGVAPSDANQTVFVNVYTWNGSWFDYNQYCDSAIILTGESSAGYSCTLSNVTADVIVQAQLHGNDEFFDRVYYHSSGSVWRQSEAQPLAAGAAHANIDLELVKGVKISGTIVTPDGESFSENNFLWVGWLYYPDSNSSYETGSFYSFSNTLLASSSSLSYEMMAPADGGFMKIYYSWSDPVETGYMNTGYYGNPDTQYLKKNGDMLEMSVPHTGIDLTLLKGVPLTGTFSLPNGDTNSTDISVGIYVREEDTWEMLGQSSVLIPANTNSADFSLSLIPGKQGSLSYYLWDVTDNSYMQYGYLAAAGMTINSYEALVFSTSSPPVGPAMQLIPAVSLSGTISLPNGDTNSTDISVGINVSEEDTWEMLGQSSVLIPANTNSADFSLSLMPGRQGVLSYYFSDVTDNIYSQYGYLAAAGMTSNEYEALVFSTSSPPAGPAMQLIPGVSLSGTVKLSPGDTFTEPVEVYVDVMSEDSAFLGSSWATIAANETSATWRATIPEGYGNIIVMSWLNKNYFDPDPRYLDNSYYNSTGMVGLIENAELLDGSISHSDLALTLLKGELVSGTVSLQSPDTFAGDGDMLITANWGVENVFWFLPYQYIDYRAGDTTVAYSLAIPSDAPDYTIGYDWMNAPAPYVREGFYTSEQNGLCEKNAFRFTAGVDYPGTDILLLKSFSLKGDISLPVGATTPVDLPITLGVIQSLGSGTYATTMTLPIVTTIPAGDNSVPYEFSLPVSCADTPELYAVGYRHESNNYVRNGFYNSTGTVGLIDDAELLDIGLNHTGIDLFLELILQGDITADGVVDLTDAIIGLQILIGKTITEDIVLGADVNGDGKLGMAEVLSILNGLKN